MITTPTAKEKQPLTKGEIHSILQSIWEMADKQRMPNEYDHYTLFLRTIAFQQFLYQIDFNYAHLSRQSIIFSGLEKNHYIYKAFKDSTGLEVQEYLDLSFVTVSRFLSTNESFLPENWFSTVRNSHSNQKVDSFLATISKDIDGIRETLVTNDDRKRPAVEYSELTPFIEFPLIKIKGKYILTHKNILYRRFEYFIYDLMRNLDAEKFMEKFGILFERYVEKSLEHSKTNFLNEQDIERLLGKKGNQIDFLVQDESSNIFIDAKAVEMNAQGKTTHSSEIIRNKTKKSILRAIKQAHDVIRKIEDSNAREIPSSQNNYLLVITFKDLYLGNRVTHKQ
ncbi:MAG: hypothetical protein P1U80_00005 [Pseudomonadales bacterium]|nr:hypothetical protein [Pseudomonadales bacterium]